MSEYLRSLTLYAAMFFVMLTIAGFTLYYTNVTSIKQDTYKNFMYTGMNQATLRLEGAEKLANGDFNAYYMDENGTYDQLNIAIIKQLALVSKYEDNVSYKLIRNTNTNEYFLHIKASDVDSVIKFKLEDGR